MKHNVIYILLNFTITNDYGNLVSVRISDHISCLAGYPVTSFLQQRNINLILSIPIKGTIYLGAFGSRALYLEQREIFLIII